MEKAPGNSLQYENEANQLWETLQFIGTTVKYQHLSPPNRTISCANGSCARSHQ